MIKTMCEWRGVLLSCQVSVGDLHFFWGENYEEVYKYCDNTFHDNGRIADVGRLRESG